MNMGPRKERKKKKKLRKGMTPMTGGESDMERRVRENREVAFFKKN